MLSPKLPNNMAAAESKKGNVKLKQEKHSGGELESQFILRLPQSHAFGLRKAIENGTLKDRLSIEYQADYRHATVRFDGHALSAKLVDMPSLIESYKTVDAKSFYKTADMCQMLVCNEDKEDSLDDDDEPATHRKDSKKFSWNHGITAPLKNVRKRRFRKTAKKKVQESPEIEKEVKRLLRTDISAANVTFEVLQEEEKLEDSRSVISDADLSLNTSAASLSGLATEFMASSGPRAGADTAGSSDDDERNELLAMLREASSDEEEEGLEMMLEDDDDDEEMNQSAEPKGEGEEEIDVEGSEMNEEVDSELRGQLEVVAERLEEIKAQKSEQEARVNQAANPFLKQRFQAKLEELIVQEREQKEEYRRLENSLSRR